MGHVRPTVPPSPGNYTKLRSRGSKHVFTDSRVRPAWTATDCSRNPIHCRSNLHRGGAGGCIGADDSFGCCLMSLLQVGLVVYWLEADLHIQHGQELTVTVFLVCHGPFCRSCAQNLNYCVYAALPTKTSQQPPLPRNPAKVEC